MAVISWHVLCPLSFVMTINKEKLTLLESPGTDT